VTPGVLAIARPWQDSLDAHGLPAALAAAGVRLIINLQEARWPACRRLRRDRPCLVGACEASVLAVAALGGKSRAW